MTGLAVAPEWFTQPVEVNAYAGEGAHGPVYETSRILLGYVAFRRQLVRSERGDEVVSEASVFLPPSAEGLVPPESRVRIRGHEGRVLAAQPHLDPYGRLVYVEVTTA